MVVWVGIKYIKFVWGGLLGFCVVFMWKYHIEGVIISGVSQSSGPPIMIRKNKNIRSA